jgi:hypothetical protein
VAVMLLHRSAGLQLERTIFMGEECRARPVMIPPREEVPAENRQLAGHGDSGDLVAALRSDPHEEGVQRSQCLGGCPRGLDEHRPGMAASDLADLAVVGGISAITAAFSFAVVVLVVREVRKVWRS